MPPRKKRHWGKGGGGGGNQPHIKPALAPTCPHPFHRQKNPKSLWFGWEREGGRGGGAILIIIHPRWLRGQAQLASDPFFGGGGERTETPPIIFRELLQALSFSILGVQKRGNSACFCNIFERLVDFPILGGNNEFFLDKFPPIIFRELVALSFSKFGCKTETILSVLPYVFLRLLEFSIFRLQKSHWAKFRQLFAENLWGLCDFKIFGYRTGKCCPFFTHFFSGFLIFWFGAPRRTKFRQLFPQNLWRFFDSHFFDAEQGEMLPVFHPICFWGVLTFRLRSKNMTGQNSANYLQRTFEGFVIWNCGWKKEGGKCCPFFTQFFLGLFDFLIWGSKENKIPPIISTICEGFSILTFLMQKRGKCARFSPNLSLRGFDFPIALQIYYWTEFRQLYAENFWRLCDLKLWVKKRGEVLPVFHPNFFEAFQVSDFGLQGE